MVRFVRDGQLSRIAHKGPQRRSQPQPQGLRVRFSRRSPMRVFVPSRLSPRKIYDAMHLKNKFFSANCH
jgi:hypothetical protein